MNTFYSLIVYMLIGGVFTGLYGNEKYEICNGKTELKLEEAIYLTVAWPGIFATGIIYNPETDGEISCE